MGKAKEIEEAASNLTFNKRKLKRKDFLKLGAAAGLAAVTSGMPKAVLAGGEDKRDPAKRLWKKGDDVLLRMQDDLNRALRKPMKERTWAMVLDIRKCIGCSACAAACIAENNLPVGVMYRTVAEVEDGVYPDVRRFFMPTNCMQCAAAPCIEAANKIIPGSMSRRQDGIVVIDYRKMKGKKIFEAANKACPYPRSLWYDEGKNYTDGTPAVQSYEKRPFKEYGSEWVRRDVKDTTRKCHFCTQRLDAGVLPACVTTCTGQTMNFGDLNDPESLVSELLKENKSFRLDLASKAEPKNHYLDDNPEKTCMACHG